MSAPDRYAHTPHTQPPTGYTRARFRLLRFRSPLLTEYLQSRGTKMFHFPPHHQHAIHSHTSDHQQRWPGFPIRTPSDHSQLVDSPRLNADRHVLLRPFMPRHPPNALNTYKKQQNKTQQTHSSLPHTTTKSHASKDARIHYTIPKHHTNTPHTNTTVSVYEGGTGIEPKSLTACRACPKHPTTQQQPNIDHHSGIVISP